MVADALSRKPASLNAVLDTLPLGLQQEVAQLNLVIVNVGLANTLEVTPTLEEDIHMSHADAKIMQGYLKRLHERKT